MAPRCPHGRTVLVLAIAIAAASGCGNARSTADQTAESTRPPRSTSPPQSTSPPVTEAVASAPPSGILGPEGDLFYVPPDPLPPGAPGDLIWSTPLPAPAGTQAWKILYHSRTAEDGDTAVSGVLVTPAGAPPPEGRPVVAIAPGTTGLADQCSASKTAEGLVSSPLVQQHIASGHVVVGTDYEGLGTPGLHPYGVGESAGRNLLDAARSATHVADAGAGTRVVLFGHSQGGHAAFFAGGIAPTYAPELEVLGVVSVAPPIDLVALTSNVSLAAGSLGWDVMFVRGFAAAYPELDVRLVLTESALDASDVVESACADAVLNAFIGLTTPQVLVRAPADVPAWREVLERNSLRVDWVTAPVLLVKGDADGLLPKPFTDLFVDKLCAAEDLVEYRVYSGATHTSVLVASAADVDGWIADRFSDLPASSTCP